jgi:hypothetical protein
MASNGSSRGGLLTAGGILSIIGGAFEIIGGVIMVVLMSTRILLRLSLLQFLPRFEGACGMHIVPICLIVIGGLLLVLGILAIVGGVSALRRKSFGLSLAGAICALPSHILGILAIIFVSLSKKEFEAKE